MLLLDIPPTEWIKSHLWENPEGRGKMEQRVECIRQVLIPERYLQESLEKRFWRKPNMRKGKSQLYNYITFIYSTIM